MCYYKVGFGRKIFSRISLSFEYSILFFDNSNGFPLYKNNWVIIFSIVEILSCLELIAFSFLNKKHSRANCFDLSHTIFLILPFISDEYPII